MDFNTPYGIKLKLDATIKEIVRFMEEDKDRRYKIIVGSDSLKREKDLADFVTAVIVHREGNGGRYFWRRLELDKIHNLRNRIIQEVMFSLEAAQKILDGLKKISAPKFDFEIHIDVGENGETKSMISEVVGMVRAYNFEARTKPQSYAASKVADRHV
ncbi:ribonuclease H-like YkuK family protein [Candidatus Wolfebacteria bacterium]|nr:ribonuclease H-like YkuK family protein [Candidatus Wolfebacteria bacterium]